MTATKKPKGRPSDYSLALASVVCEEIAAGKSLREVCAMPGMPSERQAYLWLGKYTEFGEMYARAREERADLVADEIVTIADTETDPNVARVRIDARKWWASRVNPKKYGDKLQTENTNTTYVINAQPMSQDEWEQKHCMAPAGRPANGAH